MTPCAVVQQLRLSAARRTLRAGEAASVLEAALRHGLALLTPDAGTARPGAVLRLEGRVEADCAILSLVRPADGTVLGIVRERFGRRGGLA
jgi:hypothetical protein